MLVFLLLSSAALSSSALLSSAAWSPQVPVPARHASLRATPISCSATGEDDASAKRKNANRLALLAEQAALEAEALEMEAKTMPDGTVL